MSQVHNSPRVLRGDYNPGGHFPALFPRYTGFFYIHNAIFISPFPLIALRGTENLLAGLGKRPCP